MRIQSKNVQLVLRVVQSKEHSSVVLLYFPSPHVTDSKNKGKVCMRAKWPIRPEFIPVSVA